MFQSLSDKLQNIFNSLRGKGRLTEQNIQDALKEVKLALLEADVHFKVVKAFIDSVKEKAVGQEVLSSLTPAQQVIKIVHDALIAIVGSKETRITLGGKAPHFIMLCGLQGSGKTTSCGKLAAYLRKKGHKPMLVAADIYRPAAIKQLEVIGEQLKVPVFSMGNQVSPVEIVKSARDKAMLDACDVVIVDTAGRLHIDEQLMQELKDIVTAVPPEEILLVVDAMTGQDAVNIAKQFNDTLPVTGFVMTKMDGDARGGAALSIRHITEKPIKLVGTGEKLDALEPFHPERMASRILGMGDIMSLIEKAQSNMDVEKMKELEKSLREATFTFEDFLTQIEQVQKMGPLDQLLGMIPGFSSMPQMKDVKIDEKEIEHIKAIIRSMTKIERKLPSIIDGSRRKRIAAGSGREVSDVNKLLKQFEQTRKMMKQMGKMSNLFGKFGGGGGKMPFFK
ncbi:MAG: signal recognition particle protein [Candidatus Wallbacteria bacterium GWC2_49_35]|uniref:Signal recognition particle protein n=1 Tax=Candidatus Wallbacteria bacterium GWC2_49_35 TaxID=1817813 RepID=A0A1F7WEV1_9BACT|nr:MAG: signal recognition particle protein [Candidatus Wallbacteria bacterium GWC2_49_35]